MRRGRDRSALAAITAAVVALLAPAASQAQTSPEPPPASNPLKGDASWVWYVSESGGSAEAIAKSAKRRKLDAVFVKSGDGTNYWSQFTPELVDTIHAKGIDVCAWQYVYGDNPGKEAQIAARAVEAGADCFIIDAEAEYEGKYASADTYVTQLRKRVGADYPVVLATFPYVEFHPAFPYSVFMGPGGAQFNAPQLYWHDIGDSVVESYTHTFTFNRPYARPIYPVGQTYNNPPRRELKDFRRYAKAFGAGGVSWWSWQETSNSEWRTITGRSGRPKGFTPAESYPELTQGATGDLVVWLQQLLTESGFKVPINGRFSRQVASAVIELQTASSIPATGEVSNRTWEVLLQSEPQPVRWSKRGTPRALRPAPAPWSAALEPLGVDLPPVSER